MSFDPYYRWLGIPPAEQPPNHYRLLGVALFEANHEVIQEAADRQMAHVKTHKNGPHRDVSQKLLNELSAARLCLLRPADRAVYDAKLQAGQPGVPPAAANRPLPSANVAVAAPAPAAKAAPGRTGAWVGAVMGGVVLGLLSLLGLSFFTHQGGDETPLAATVLQPEPEPEPEELAEPAEAAAIEAPGLTAEVFEGSEFQRSVETRIDPQVNFFWGATAASEGLPGDDYSVRWIGWLRPPSVGKYTLKLVSDEPAKLWLDNQPLLSGGELAGQVQSALVDLEARPYAVKIEYADTKGGAWISLRWQPPGGEEEALPTWALFQDQRAASQANVSAAAEQARKLARQKPVGGRAPGLTGELFNDQDFSSLLARRVDPTLDFFGFTSSASGSTKPPGEGTGSAGPLPDQLYARWRGWLTPPAAGLYTLVLGVDDGARLWINGKLKLDAYRVGDPKRFDVPVSLKAQKHAIRVDYFKQSGDGLLTLHWIPPGGTEQAIPAECFSRDVK